MVGVNTAVTMRHRHAFQACRYLLGAAAYLLLCVACATSPAIRSANTTNDGTVFIVVRHAEKPPDGSRDPPLDATGSAHAAALAQRLQSEPLVAAYATPFRRTRMTAQPSARMHGLHVSDYDPDMDAEKFARQLLDHYRSGAVLVVGHSNTVPAIVAALCACSVAPMDDSAYGDLYRVSIDGDGRAVLEKARF